MPTATITLYSTESFVDITFDLGLFDIELISATSTEIRVRNEFDTARTTTVNGTGFVFAGDVPTAGTITSFDFFDGGQLIATMSGVSFSVVDFDNALQADEDGNPDPLDALFAPYNAVFDATNLTTQEYEFNDTGLSLGDTAIAGPGGSYMTLGAFADTYIGGSGFDQINFSPEEGGSGAQVDLLAGTAVDTFGNNETISGTIESLRGSQYGDTFRGDNERDHMRGLAGDDLLDGRGGRDYLRYDRDDRYGGTNGVFVDLLNEIAIDGFGDTDTVLNFEDVIGTEFADTITGNDSDNDLNGSGGNDTLRGHGGDDILRGGEGIDTANYADATGGVNVYMQFARFNAGSGEGRDTLIDIENLIGSAFGDRLIGDANSNVFFGGDGDDLIKGKGGNDSFIGGNGNDRMRGAEGGDDFDGGFGSDILLGLSGDDLLNGGGNRDFLYGGRDNDLLNGDGGNDVLRGNRGNDEMNGGTGDDDLRGGGNNDDMRGDDGDDYLLGEGGADRLFGGAGNDTLLGGLGGGVTDGLRDTFVFASSISGGGGFDRIRDFEDDIDKIDLSAYGFASFGDVVALASNAGSGNMRIDFNGTDTLYIDGMTLTDFDAGDVIL